MSFDNASFSDESKQSSDNRTTFEIESLFVVTCTKNQAEGKRNDLTIQKQRNTYDEPHTSKVGQQKTYEGTSFQQSVFDRDESKQSFDDMMIVTAEGKRNDLAVQNQRNTYDEHHTSKVCQDKNETSEEASYSEQSSSPTGSTIEMSCPGNYDDNDLHQLAFDGDEKKMQIALNKLEKPVHEEINKKDKCNCTLLHYAAENKHVEMCKLLVDKKADVNIYDGKGRTALHLVVYAWENMGVEYKIIEIVKLLLKNGASIDIKDEDGFTPLYYVSYYGLKDCVKLLVEKSKASIQACDNQNRTPLHIAAEYRQVKVAEEFIKYGDEILTSWTQQLAGIFRSAKDSNQTSPLLGKELLDVKDRKGCTPLHYAAKNKCFEMCKLLVHNGADVNVRNMDGSTALHIMVKNLEKINPDQGSLSPTSKENRNEMKQIVELLLRRNASVDSKDNEGRTPLHCAAHRSHVECAELLIEQYEILNKNPRNSNQNRTSLVEQQLNMKDKYGCTPLLYAAKYKHVKMCKLLVKKGADVDVCNLDGSTALHVIFYKHEEITRDLESLTPTNEKNHKRTKKIVKFLLGGKARVDIQDDDGCTPLHCAAQTGHKEGAELLIDECKSLHEARNRRKQTPLHIAVEYGHLDVAGLLIERKADVRCKDINNRTPLHLAAAKGNSGIVTLILGTSSSQRGSRFVDEIDNDGSNPLHLAVENGHLHVTQLIIDSCSGEQDDKKRLPKVFEARRKTKETPLHLAAKYDHLEIVKFLVDRGANVKECDENSNTPLILALQFNHRKVADYLLKCSENINLHVDSTLMSALLAAADRGHENMMKFILSKQNQQKDGPKLRTTPLHLAAKGGHFSAVQRLLEEKAEIDVKNKAGQTPFHLAAQNGHLDIIQVFYENKPKIVQHTDENENTPLHLAAMKGKIQVVQKLVELGAKFLARNKKQWTPLDCCADAGMYKSAEALLRAGCPPDPKDGSKTPLHLACQGGHTGMVHLLLQWKADVTHRSGDGWNALDFAIDSGNASCAQVIIESKKWKKALKNGIIDEDNVETSMRKLIQKMPDVAEKVLTKCMEVRGKDQDDPKYEIKFDYELLDDEFFCTNWCYKKQHEKSRSSNLGKVGTVLSGDFLISQIRNYLDHKVCNKKEHVGQDAIEYTRNSSSVKENHPLNIMVKAKRKMLLRHPLVVSLLNYKWRAYGRYVYYLNLLLYVIFMGIFNSYMLTMPPPYFIDFGNMTSSCVAVITEAQPVYGPCYNYNSWGIIAKPLVILLSVVNLLKELFQVLSQKFSYFKSFTNLFEVSLYFLAILTVYSDTSSAGPNFVGVREDWQWQVGAVSIFLSWMVLIMFIRNLPTFGIYVLMFNHVLRTFTKFFVVFALFIFGFALSFHCLLQNQYAFRQWWDAVIKTSIMMIGEFQFEDIFLSEVDAIETGADNHTITVSAVNYRAVSYSLFTLFLIIMSIIIMNLLVGLAVDDIKTVQENAMLKRLEMQIKLTLDVEYTLPQRIRRRVMRKYRSFRPNQYNNRTFLVKWFNSEDNLEPSTIKEAFNSEKMEHEKQVKSLDGKVKSLYGKIESMDENLKSLDHNVRSIKEKPETLDIGSMEAKISAIMSHFNIDDGNDVSNPPQHYTLTS